MDELVALAAGRDLVLMPGHLLLYHPGVVKLKELVDSGELGEVLCVYGNRQNLGIVRTNENALWSLGVHDLSVILYLLDEDPELATTSRCGWSARISSTSSPATATGTRSRATAPASYGHSRC
jgi:predicted dehydrogenase